MLKFAIFALFCDPWVHYIPKIWKKLYYHIAFIINKHHLTVKTTFGAILGVSDTTILLQNRWFMLFYVILHPVMVWNGDKMLYLVPNVHQLIQITSLYDISGDLILHNIAKNTTFGLKMRDPRPYKLV